MKCSQRLAKRCALEPDAVARTVFHALSEKLAEDIVILDIRPVTTMADFFVVASAKSNRQLKVLAEALAQAVREAGVAKASHVEGEADSGWVLVDLDDVVVHLFDEDTRAYYQLEELWSEAPLVARMP